MKVLLISSVGDAGELDICLKAQGASHEIKWFKPYAERTDAIGKGMVTRVSDWQSHMRWADLVILADNTRYLKEVDKWRGTVPIIGASEKAAAWELNRTLGQKVFEDHGIDVVPYKEFSDYDTAIAYVKKENRRFVSKPCGDEPDKSLSYVAKSPEDLVYMLQRWKKQDRLKGKFILQDFISGIEMAVGGWFGPGGFNEGWCENFEFKKLMNDDIGCNTGEMGTVLRVVKKSKLAREVLEPLQDELAKMNFAGYVDANCIIDDEGTPWPLEFTMRFGYPLINIQQELVKGDPVEWLADLAAGKDARNWRMNETAVGVVMAIGDFPHSKMPISATRGVPIYGTEKCGDSIHYCMAMMGEAPQMIGGKIVDAKIPATAGDYVLVGSGRGATISEAARRAYATVGKIEIPSSPMYRTDIGRKLSRVLPKLAEQGLAQGWVY
jgi:phosphoribosylamine--glycine ligase